MPKQTTMLSILENPQFQFFVCVENMIFLSILLCLHTISETKYSGCDIIIERIAVRKENKVFASHITLGKV